MTTLRLQEVASENGYFYPVDFASRGSSQVGGNIATNAGGIRVLRYGMTRDWVAGLTVVTGAGDVLVLNRSLVKNATGYDLRHLMIGSEGTLGIVVEATMRLTKPPREQQVAVLAVPALEAIAELFQLLSVRLELSAFEFFDQRALEHVIAAGERRPFDSSAPYYVLAEFDEDTDAATSAFEQALSNGTAIDGVLSQSASQASALWRLREFISATLAPRAPYKCDIAVRRSGVVDFMRDLGAQVSGAFPEIELVWFGHVGDGNLHLNVLRPEAMNPTRFGETCAEFTESLCRILSEHGGTISAEHGVGMLKKPYLHHTRSRAEIDYMRAVKQSFDPDGILNPGKIFDQAT
jgi:FAD/FMN-containing dehydrogenase